MSIKTLSISAAALMLALPVLAQDAPRPPAAQQQPQQQVQQQPTGGATTQGGMQFIERQQAGQWLASRFMDRTVYGTDGNSIGDINDVLVDRNGQIAAVVIGVGGFLGIGEKNVAVPFRMLQMQAAPARTGDGAPATTTQAPPAGQTTTTTTTTTASDGDLWSDRNARLVLRATRDELRNAPTFTELEDRATARTNTDSRTNERAPGTAPTPPQAPAR